MAAKFALPPELATKSTFYLSDSRRARLKAIAAERRTTVTELLAEGADLVIERYRGLGDAEELARRAKLAREQLRQGLYESTSVADEADRLLYPRPRRSSADEPGSRKLARAKKRAVRGKTVRRET